MNTFTLPKAAVAKLNKLKGPIFIFGAGGFIGMNLLNSILLHRKDVFGISQDARSNWRFLASDTPQKNLISCDITQPELLRDLLRKHQPKTVF